MHWQPKPKALQNNQQAKQTQKLTEIVSRVVRGGVKSTPRIRHASSDFKSFYTIVRFSDMSPPPAITQPKKKENKMIGSFLFSLQASDICPALSGCQGGP